MGGHQQMGGPQHMGGPQQSGMTENNINHQHIIEQFQDKPSHNISANSPSCLEIADHVSNCPICSRFYKNDNTIYIIAIVVLLIICILLLKKCLDI